MPADITQQLSREQQIAALEKDWANNPRWKGVKRGYSAADVVRLRGSMPIEHTLAKRGAEKLWEKNQRRRQKRLRQCLRCDLCRSSHATSQSRPGSRVPVGLASGC